MELLSVNIEKLKDQFVKSYSGKSHIHEILPSTKTDFLPIDEKHLKSLHEFLDSNPIYDNSYEVNLCGISCRIFEGDLNQFWIDSIKHDTSYAPFYPTWMLSAYFLAIKSKHLGFSELIDIGSGDGRIAFCGKIIGMNSYSIEIDENLTNLQNSIIKNTGVEFNTANQDATKINFEDMNLISPVFFIGGLPQNGEILAEYIVKNILTNSMLSNSSCFTLTGTIAKRKFDKNHNEYGWMLTINKFNLKNIYTVFLPTYWTMDQPFNTPYVFTKKSI
jgi:hypothetical protein